MTQDHIQHAGFVAILGAPNAGKSTLLNQMLGERLSIVTHKAQTTRIRVLGLLTQGNTQIGLIDTPGIFKPKSRLEKAMVQAAWDSLDGVDMILLLVDASARQPDPKVDEILESLAKRKVKATMVLNKVDKIKLEKLLPMTERMHATGLFDEIYMVSALTGDGVPELKTKLLAGMPVGPWHYPEDQLTDVSERLLAAEITREQLLCQLHDELPYMASVIPESWEERKDGSALIRQTILVTKAAHRAMVLGKNGARIKEIGSAARQEMVAFMGRPVHLFLDVKADERWQEKNEFYRLFGLDGASR
ncbi:MAG: GTPase Era [Alphaproteobacteria bacterium]|nr:GTPase Era [Alphaproteobacteria bacterium]